MGVTTQFAALRVSKPPHHPAPLRWTTCKPSLPMVVLLCVLVTTSKALVTTSVALVLVASCCS